MNSRERVLRALKFNEPDRVPIDFGGTIVSSITRNAYNKLHKYLYQELMLDAPTMEICQDIVIPNDKIFKLFGSDFRRISLKPSSSWDLKVSFDGCFTNEWGIRFKKFGYYYDIIENPIKEATFKALDLFDWPDPSEPSRYMGLEKQARDLFEHGEYAIIADMVTAGVFFHAMRLRGFESFLTDMAVRPKFALALMEKLVELYEVFYMHYLGAVGKYVDIVAVADDLGTQKGLMISPKMYRKYVKPLHKRLYSFIKNHTDAKIMMHSDGAIEPLIKDFIETGVDILNPIQTSAAGMITNRLKELYGSRLVFHGGIDIQTVLSQGAPKDVEEEVKRVFKDLGKNGGYIMAATHNIQPDCPPENIIALYESAQNIGVY